MLRVREVLESVSRVSGHSFQEVLTRRELAIYRQVTAFIVHKCGRSLSHIARALNSDHKNISYAVRRIESKLSIESHRIFIGRVLLDLEQRGCKVEGAQRALSANDRDLTAPTPVVSAEVAFEVSTAAMAG